MNDLGISTTILCVDDEPAVLGLLRINLDKIGRIEVASSGEQALDWMAVHGAPAVVVSDMSMGGMDGVHFLSQVREFSPDTSRILLTGHGNMASAIAAVNEGRVFRYLTKPFRDFELTAAVSSAMEQHRLARTERTLLERTLKGCAQALVDLLALADPVAYGRAQRIRHRSTELSREMGIAPSWQMDIAGLLSQAGSVTLPRDVSEKLEQGLALSADEQALVDHLPAVAMKLLAGIPRLEEVQGMLQASLPDALGAPHGEDVLLQAGRILRAATELEPLLGISAPSGSLGAFLKRWESLDGNLASAVKRMTKQTQTAEPIGIRGLKEGMVLAEDIRSKAGMLLVSRGFHVTEGLLEKITNFKPGTVVEPIYVLAA